VKNSLFIIIINKIGCQHGSAATGFYFTGLAIWLGSVVTTITDGIRQRPEFQQKWSVSGVVGATSLSITAACLVGYYVWVSQSMMMSLDDNDLGTTTYQSSWKQTNTHFSQYIYFDWIRDSEKEREPLPAGSGAIVGKFIYAGKPAQGVKLKVLLAGGYETETLTTDDKGLFKIPVAPGSWTVQLVKELFKLPRRISCSAIMLAGYYSFSVGKNAI